MSLSVALCVRLFRIARKAGTKGIRIQCSVVLNGTEMGRREWYREGSRASARPSCCNRLWYCMSRTMGAVGMGFGFITAKMPGQPTNPALETPLVLVVLAMRGGGR